VDPNRTTEGVRVLEEEEEEEPLFLRREREEDAEAAEAISLQRLKLGFGRECALIFTDFVGGNSKSRQSSKEGFIWLEI